MLFRLCIKRESVPSHKFSDLETKLNTSLVEYLNKTGKEENIERDHQNTKELSIKKNFF